jgi:alpha-2-macroglobulin
MSHVQKRAKVAVASFVAAALVIAAVWIGVDRLGQEQAVIGPEPGANAQVTLTADKADAAGVDPVGGFKLTSTRPLTAAALRQTLSVQPAVDLKIEPASGSAKEFRIQPARALDPNRVYRFALAAAGPVARPFGWSFQTKSPFRVVSSLPRDHSGGVPVTTGIELIFSHEHYADPDGLFTISPKVEGRFERHKKTLAFVPKNPLTPGTIYTVTLKQGLGQKDADGKIAADYTFAFETEPEGGVKGGEQSWFEMPSAVQEFATADAPYFQFLYHKGGKELAPETQVTVYRYQDAAAFTSALTEADKLPWWSNFGRRSYREAVSGLKRVTGFKAAPTPFAGVGSYLLFPEKLASGYYLAEFQVEDQIRQTRFQVTDLSSYLMVTTTQTLVWINDLNTKSPVAGARVQVAGGGDSATTGSDGVAVLPTPAGAQRKDGSAAAIYLHVQGAGGQEAVVAAQSGAGGYGYGYYGGPDREKASLYWRYLYLDRSLYKPEDPVNLWGVIRPREPGAAPMAQVTAEVIRSDYRDEADKPIPLASVDLKIDEGTFTGTLRLPGVQPGWYELQVRSGEDWLYSQWFEVQTYVKPAYQIDLTQDKRAAFAGDKVTFTAGTTFFDGTPVPNLSLGYGLSYRGDDATLTTDANGQASVTLTMPDSGNGEWGGPSDTWFNIRSTLPEAGEITTGTSVQVFGRDVTLKPELKVTNGQATVTGKANLVTLEPLNQGTGWDWTGGPAAGRTVRGTLKQIILHQRENGEYYDFIRKQVVKQYYYERELKEAGTFQALTDSSGQFVQTLLVDPKESYELDLQVEDTHGRAVIRKLYFYGKGFQEYENYPWHYYYLSMPENQDAWPSGQPVTLTFQEGEQKVENRVRGFLFATLRLGLQGWQVQDSGAFQYSLKASDPPNTNIHGVYFDGRLYRETQDRPLRLDPLEREMQVTVTADKATYRPGEAVSVTVQAKDSQGRPAGNARVNLNLVDEALFALRDQRINTLSTLYGDYVGTGLLRTRASHTVPSPGGGAEKGGEGGGVRKDFKDAVFFGTVVTDARGKATASFKVPDNLTMWRLTWQALSPGTMEAASGTIGIPVKLPFFVELNPGESFLAGDKPALLLRSYGTALKEGQGVRYQVQLSGPGGDQKATIEGKAFTPTYWNVPELTAGTYSLTVRATAGGTLEDAVEKRFTVQDSYLRQTKVEHYLLSQELQLAAPEKGIATLTFTDAARSRYLNLLQQLRWEWGSRFEQKLARSVATGLLKKHFDYTDPWPEQELNAHAYQTPEGAVAILPYADGDLRLSALAADLAAERFDQTALARYFDGLLQKDSTSRSQAVLALYGLASLDRPVLQQVDALLAESSLTLAERLTLALARAKLGDLEGARPIYREIVQAQSEPVGSAARIKAGRDQDEILTHTALAGVLAARLGEPEAPAYAEYLATTPGKDVLTVMEQALIAQAALPRILPEAASFTYVLNGKEEQKELKPGQTVRLPVPAGDVAGLKFKAIKGQVGLTVTYEAAAGTADLKKEAGFSLVRSYSVTGKGSGTKLAPGDLVKVTLVYQIPDTAPAGSYELSDYLPAGLRLVERPWQYGVRFDKATDPAWPISVDGQRVTFWTSKQGDPISYYARVTGAGQFTADSPTLQLQKSGQIYMYGGRDQVQIAW